MPRLILLPKEGFKDMHMNALVKCFTSFSADIELLQVFILCYYYVSVCKRPHIFISSCQLSIFQFCWIWYVEAKDLKIGELICIFDFMIIIWLWEMMFKSRLLLLSLFFFLALCLCSLKSWNIWQFLKVLL